MELRMGPNQLRCLLRFYRKLSGVNGIHKIIVYVNFLMLPMLILGIIPISTYPCVVAGSIALLVIVQSVLDKAITRLVVMSVQGQDSFETSHDAEISTTLGVLIAYKLLYSNGHYSLNRDGYEKFVKDTSRLTKFLRTESAKNLTTAEWQMLIDKLPLCYVCKGQLSGPTLEMLHALIDTIKKYHVIMAIPHLKKIAKMPQDKGDKGLLQEHAMNCLEALNSNVYKQSETLLRASSDFQITATLLRSVSEKVDEQHALLHADAGIEEATPTMAKAKGGRKFIFLNLHKR